MSLLRNGVRAAQRFIPRAASGSRWILAYHLVDGGTDSPVDLPMAEFRRHMERLASGPYEVVSLRGIEATQGAHRTRVALTFDDAFANFAEVVLPVLREHDLPATLFVPTGFIDGAQGSPLTGAALRPCSWDELAEVADAGVEIGSHTVSHRNLRRLDTPMIDRELVDSKRRLEERVGVGVNSFCYPQAKWSPTIRARVGRVYERAVVAGGRTLGRRDDRCSLPRLPLRRGGPPLDELLSREVWLEEQIASVVRQLRA